MADGDIKKMQVVVEAKTDGVKQKLDTVSRGVDDVKNAIQSATGISFGNLESSLRTTYTEAKKVTTELAKTFSPAQIKQGIQQSKAQMRSAEKEMRKYADTGGQMFKNASFDYQDAKGRLDALTGELNKVKDVANNIEIKGLKEDKPLVNVKAINKELVGNLKKSGYYTPDVDTIKNTYQGVELNNYKPTANIDDFVNKMAYVSPEIEKVTTKLGTLKFHLKKAFSQEGLEKFSEKMSWLSQKAGALDRKMTKFAKTVGGIGKKFLSAISPMKLFRNEQNKTAHSSGILGKAFSRLARMFRIMVTRMLIRGFISNIREGFQNIAQYSDEVNQKFSAIIGSAKTLYNAFASALTPIIEAVAPAVIRVLDFMISVMNKVAEFMSALTGKSYFIKATKYNYDYAKSLESQTKATNKNTKATDKNKKKKKELKDAQIGIDRLNVISPNKDNTSTSGNNGGNGNGNKGANVNDMFDTKPVSKKMQDLAKKVKQIAKKLFDPIQEAWNKKGSKVLTSMKKMLESIWKTVKDIGRDFLTMWQQPATEKIFEDILDTVSLIFDIVKAISDQFRKAWNKDNIGLHIFENLRDVVGIIVKGIKNCAKYTKKWAENLNFSPLLESIERYTKSLKKLMKGLVDIASDFYKIVVLGISKWVIEKGLPKLIQVFTDFNNKVDWQSLRKSLKVLWDGIENLVEAIGDGLVNVLGDLMDAFANLLNSKWFQNLIKAIGNLMKSIKPKHIEWFVKAWLGVKAIKFVGGLFGKIATKVGGVIKVIKWFKYTNVGAKIIKSFGSTGKIGGFFVNLANQLKGVGTTAGTTFGTSFKSALSGVIGGSGLLTNIIGGAGIVAGSVAIANIIALPYKQASDEAKKLDKEVEEHAKKVAMPEAYRKRLEKMTEVNKKIHEEFNAHKEVNGEVLNNYENVKRYKEELDKIVGKNGKIKEGYELQAQVLVDQINEALGINLEIVDGQIKGYKDITKQLEKQIELVTIKNLAEKNAEKYYKAKSGIGGKYKELQSNKKAYNDSEAVQKYLSYNDLYKDAKAGMKLAKSRGDEGAYERYKAQKETYKKWRDEYAKDYKALKDAKNNSSKVYRDYYRTILRQNALYQAKNKKQREQAIANLEKPLTDAEIKNLNTLEKISKATGVSLEKTIEKYYKNGKIQYDKLPKVAKNALEKTNKAVKKGSKKGVKEVVKDWNKVLVKSKLFKKDGDLFNSIHSCISDAVSRGDITMDEAFDYASALTQAYDSGKDISKYIHTGIIHNKKKIKTATDDLKKLVGGIPSKKDTKVNIKGKDKYKSDSKDAGDSAKKNVPKELTTTIKLKLSAKNVGKSISKKIKKELGNYKFDHFTIGTGGTKYAVYVDKKGNKKTKKVPKGYASGGYPKLGSEFIAGEKGAEFVGNINGKTGVASNQEITGIRDSIESSSSTQNQILMEQNKLLVRLLEKNTDIVLDGQKITKRVNKINARSGYKMATT